MIIELLGLLYGIAKDLKSYQTYEEKDKIIDQRRLTQIEKAHEEKGDMIEFRISDPDKIEGIKQNGWDYYYEIDEDKKTKSLLKMKNGQIIIARQKK